MSDRVFICYARDDQDFVIQLATNLKARGVPVWLDQWDIPAGADWDRAIDNAICECAKFIIVLSPQAVDSSEVRGELRTAMDEKRPIIPVIRSQCRVPRQLRTIQYVDFSSKIASDANALDQVVRTLLNAGSAAAPSSVRDEEPPTTPPRTEPKRQPPLEKHAGDLFDKIDRRYAMAAAGVAVAVALAFWIFGFKKVEPPPPPPSPLAYDSSSAPEVKPERPAEIAEPKAITKSPAKVESVGKKEESKAMPPGSAFRDRLKSGGNGPEMVVIPAGSFQMGDLQGGGNKVELPVHSVQISNSFALSRFEVTFDDYDAFAKATNRSLPRDAGWGRGRRPVIYVSWEAAYAYANWLSEQTGKRYRLPSEAEWEYAARGGSRQDKWAGTSSENDLVNYAWFTENSGGKTQSVGTKRANRFGVHDLSGNVWEWVQDCWNVNYNGAPVNGSAWLAGDCGQRVIRGGSWAYLPETLRSSLRTRYYTGLRSSGVGFRLAQDLP